VKDIDSKFNELKEYSTQLDTEKLNKRIYDLNMDENFLKSLPQGKLIYIHVKLHNSLYYNKPFAKMNLIKKAHDLVAGMLDNHIPIDKLDS